MRIWRFRPGRGGSGWVGVRRVLLKTGQNLCGTSSPEPQNLQNLPDPRQNLARTLTEPPRQNLRTSERDPRRFWRFWRGLGEVFGGSEVLGQNLRFCIQNLVLVLYAYGISRYTPSDPGRTCTGGTLYDMHPQCTHATHDQIKAQVSVYTIPKSLKCVCSPACVWSSNNARRCCPRRLGCI